MIKRVFFSEAAYRKIVSEVKQYEAVETGGIFLGHFKDSSCYIIECIDPGYFNTIRNHSYFEYDHGYVNYQANVVAREYKIKLGLVGLWHRHPGSMDTFSNVDDGTNLDFASRSPFGAISSLVNIDPKFRLTVYHVDNKPGIFGSPKYSRLKDVSCGNAHIPAEYLQKYEVEHIIETIQSRTQYGYGAYLPQIQKIKTDEQKVLETELLDSMDSDLDYLDSIAGCEYTISPVDHIKKSVTLKANLLLSGRKVDIVLAVSKRPDNSFGYTISSTYTDKETGTYRNDHLKQFCAINYINKSANKFRIEGLHA